MNKKTKYARSKGFCSMDDMNRNGNKIFAGSNCDTAFGAAANKHKKRKVYNPKKMVLPELKVLDPSIPVLDLL
jgi:hypothetical protein